MNIKKILKYVLYLLPWFFSSILSIGHYKYYNSLNLPFFAPPNILFSIIWSILFILIAYTIYKIYPTSDKYYKKVLLINYFSCQLFTILFFNLENLFLAFIDTVIVFISSLYLYEATHNYDKKLSKFLIPYIIWNLFALILSLTITVMN